jgi:hypothetical protein
MARHEQRARNEVLFRNMNERVSEISEGLDMSPVGAPAEHEEFFCECGGLDCAARVAMSRDEYEAVRRHPARFLTLEDHADPEIERIVERHNGYVVVEKLPGEQDVAVETDPRAAQ